MSALPKIVKKYLNQHNVIAHESSEAEASASRWVEVSVLEDQLGRVQVFFSSDNLLDLNKLRQQTGRNLRAISLKSLKKILDRAGLATIPAFDELLNLETIIDERLLKTDSLILYSGNAGEYFKISDPGQLKKSAASRVLDVCCELPDDALSYEKFLERDEAAINNSLANFTTLRIQKRLQETLEIPPLPETAKAIINLRSDPDADVDKLSKIVEQDPSLAAQVVSWASSSYYSAPGSVRSIQDAIFRVLGYDLVMNLALGLSLGKSLSMPKDSPEGYKSYWQEAVYVAAMQAQLLNLIPQELRPPFGMAYLSGLLHNFGNLILSHAFPPHFEQYCRLQEVNPHLSPQQLEMHLLGINRDQIAAALLKGWNLPGEVIYGIRYQNALYYQGLYFDFSRLNHISLSFLKSQGILPGTPGKISNQLLDSLHIDKELIPETVKRVRESIPELDMIVKNLTSE